MAPELITIGEAAARVHVTAKQIRRRVKAGLLAAVRPSGARAYLVSAADVDRLYATVLLEKMPTPRESARERRLLLLATAGFDISGA
jgi:excisionase family DNA binding protein